MASLDSSLPARMGTDRTLPVVAAAVAIVCGLGALAYVETQAAAIMVAAPLIPFVLYGAIRGAAGQRTYGSLLAAVVIFILCANFRYRDFTDKSIDFQVALKLLAMASILGVSVLSFRTIVRHLQLAVLSSWLAFFGVLILSSSYASAPLQAAIGSMSLMGGFLFVCLICVKFGPFRLVEILIWTGLVMCVGSLVVYFAVPELGRMKDWDGDDLVLTSRIQGLFGTSNGAGSACAMLVLLNVGFYIGKPNASRVVAYTTLATSLICLILSNNRMGIASLVISGLVYFLVIGNFGTKLLLLISLGVLVAVPVQLFPDEIFGLLSRSGSADEITSATGRSRIWSVVLELIPQAWLFGRGYASALHILPLHPDLFFTAAHCHNLYLETIFCSGIIGLALLLWSMLATIVLAYRVGGARELALFVYFIPYGLMEPVIGGNTYLGIVVWQAGLALLLHRAKAIQNSQVSEASHAVGSFRADNSSRS